MLDEPGPDVISGFGNRGLLPADIEGMGNLGGRLNSVGLYPNGGEKLVTLSNSDKSACIISLAVSFFWEFAAYLESPKEEKY